MEVLAEGQADDLWVNQVYAPMVAQTDTPKAIVPEETVRQETPMLKPLQHMTRL